MADGNNNKVVYSPGPRSKVNAMSKEDISENKIKMTYI